MYAIWLLLCFVAGWFVARRFIHPYIERLTDRHIEQLNDPYRYTQAIAPSQAQRIRELEHDTAMCKHRELDSQGWYCPLIRAEVIVDAWMAEIEAAKKDGTWNRFAYDRCPLCDYRVGALRVGDHLEEHLKELRP